MTEREKGIDALEPAFQEKPASYLKDTALHYITFCIGDRQLAFPLEKVERVIRMVALVRFRKRRSGLPAFSTFMVR